MGAAGDAGVLQELLGVRAPPEPPGHARPAEEERRPDALKQIQQLRDRGFRVDYPLTPTKVARQFQAAEELGASLGVLYGDEWPQLKIKNMATGEQELVPHENLKDYVAAGRN